MFSAFVIWYSHLHSLLAIYFRSGFGYRQTVGTQGDEQDFSKQCTMGKLKKIAESGQLWELISPQFFLQKKCIILPNAVITTQEYLKFFVLKKLKKKGVKKAKNMLLMFVKVKLGVKKIVLVNAKIFAFNTILTNYHPHHRHHHHNFSTIIIIIALI